MRETGDMRKITRVKAKETKKEGVFKAVGSDQKYFMQLRNQVRALKNMDSI